jgi:hypothetical protein
VLQCRQPITGEAALRDPFRTFKTAWVEFSKQVGGEYTSYTHNTGARVVVKEGPWQIVFTDYYNDVTLTVAPHTIVTATFIATHNLRFGIRRATVLSTLFEMAGLHDIHTGDAAFDADYVLKGNDGDAIRTLFSDADLRGELIQAPPQRKRRHRRRP